jgi:hypothetical protein
MKDCLLHPFVPPRTQRLVVMLLLLPGELATEVKCEQRWALEP